ncbi:HNH endonuclease [Gluconobacter kondonii]|uniref:HNH endonuclease n=1 Tax=Gluconobacter kondonii TaxID=941463 RepID=UPI001B8BAEED|nr:hypothetical protein [Gluconobacter kondonii]MBS1053457.1 hypothetical protein [Gluconobacter kondonii]
MTDPYRPLLASINFTEAEKAAIAAALTTAKPWDWKPDGAQEVAIKSVKAKLRDLHMARHGDRCCYCRKNLHGGGHFVIDREHVLPKSLTAFKLFAYEVWNLGTACKRCNMQYKKDKVDFVVDQTNAAALQTSANYLLIHPNYDLYKEHIRFVEERDDDSTLLKFTKQGTPKGEYTYQYFNLEELEVNKADVSQGRLDPEDLGEGALEAKAIAAEFDQ